MVTEPEADGAVYELGDPFGVVAGLNEPQAPVGAQVQLIWSEESWATVATTLERAPAASVVGAVVIVTLGELPPQPATANAQTESRTIQRVLRFIASLRSFRCWAYHALFLRCKARGRSKCYIGAPSPKGREPQILAGL